MGFPYLRNPCLRNPCFRNSHRWNPCLRNSHRRNFSRIQAPLNQTPLRLPPNNLLNLAILLVFLGEYLRRGYSQSEFQVTNFFSCSEECGEVFGDIFLSRFFLGKNGDRKLATKNPPHFSLPNSKFHHLELLGPLSCKMSKVAQKP